jgi:hypothetical protein
MASGTDRILDYLRNRGYLFGDVCTNSHTGEFCVPFTGHLLNFDRLRELADYESCKDANASPDGFTLEEMAKNCQKIAEHPSVSSLAADEGRDLARRFDEWKDPNTEVSPEQLRVLCTRMAYFLTREFAFLLPEERSAASST